MKEKVLEIWPEIDWIKNKNLRSQTLDAWVYAIEQSPLDPKDLEEIPFSLLIKDCNISFMNHSNKENHICPLGNIAGFLLPFWFIGRHYIKSKMKYNQLIMNSFLFISFFSNLNAFFYFLPIYFIEFFSFTK